MVREDFRQESRKALKGNKTETASKKEKLL